MNTASYQIIMIMIRFTAIATAISSYIALLCNIKHFYIIHINTSTYQHFYISALLYISTSTYQHFYMSALLYISTSTYQHFYISALYITALYITALLHISTSTYRELLFPPLDQMILSTLGQDTVLFHMISHIKRYVCTYMTNIPVTIFFFSRMEL